MVGKYLDCSTAHLTEETLQYLDESWRLACGMTASGIVIYPKLADSGNADSECYGYLIAVAGDEILEDEPDDLADLIQEAFDSECGWINLDRDAEIIEDLPVYGEKEEEM